MTNLEDTLRATLGGLDDERLDVLPVLLEQRDEKVDRDGEVLNELILSEADVTDGDADAEHLLELKLDSAAEVVALLGEIVGVRDQRRELAELVRRRAEQTRNLTQQRVGREERVVRLAQLLDGLLGLLELLEGLNVQVGQLERGGLVNVRLVAENHHRELGLGRVRQLDRAGETLVLLRIIVLQTNLKFNGFSELALGFSRCLQNVLL
jgi:hypothetical protein